MLGKFGDMMGKLQEMKQKADEIKKKLNDTVIKTEGAGGDIVVEINGNREIKRLSLTEELRHGDKQTLEEQLVAALNKAIRAADKLSEEEMKKAAGGLLPGL